MLAGAWLLAAGGLLEASRPIPLIMDGNSLGLGPAARYDWTVRLTTWSWGPTAENRILDKGYRIGYRIKDIITIVHPELQE